MSAKKLPKEPSFEEDLARLEALADQMESGELPLEALLSTYEDGSALAKTLLARLDKARAQLSEVKTTKDGSITVSPSGIAVQASLLDELEP